MTTLTTIDEAFDNLLAASQTYLDLLQELVSRTEAHGTTSTTNKQQWAEPALQLMDPSAHFSDEERGTQA